EAKARHEVERGAKTKLFEIMEERGRDRLTSGIWERALEHDDELAKKLIDRAIVALGAGIGSAVNLIDPEAVIFGGGLGIRFGESHSKQIQKQIHKHLFVDERPPAFAVAELGDLGGAIGAALLVKR
ncbi:MAG: ROK family protein, partial [Actinomycetota bacterium]|nr:ROK family protein [Actinomycetota bacterium]